MNRDDIICKFMDADGHMNDFSGGIEISWDNLVKGAMQLIEAEREACAKCVETRARHWDQREVPLHGFARELDVAAEAIRARGRKTSEGGRHENT